MGYWCISDIPRRTRTTQSGLSGRGWSWSRLWVHLKTHAPLQTRVGIATGLVVVGDLIGSGASQEQAIVGETPNLAARLQGVAEPNSVVIAESTRKLVGNLFELEDLGRTGPQGHRRTCARLDSITTELPWRAASRLFTRAA